MLLWIAIVLLLDSGFALWNENRIHTLLPRWNIRVVALIEAGAALVLGAFHFWRSS